MKKGAPQKYTDKQLKDILLKYISKNPGKKINPSILERETGVNRFVWKRRMSEQIAMINEPMQLENTETETSLPLPNVVELVETYWNNKSGLISALSHFNQMLNALHQKAKESDTILKQNQDLAANLSIKEKQIKMLENEIKLLRQQYLEVAVKSTYKTFQDEEALEKIISITKNKKSEDRALNADIVKMYPELFDN
ncbi:hypothetical protein C7121_12255 [Paenibacillus glucanolyticus]|jgi:predicted RNase H-like nuclease (RuvC/YqgF family)|uniref:Uncharacterized protein n=3 Tax=Paenibacillus TaxID=44249 RepID=A0A163GVT5_9BACL|nr:MULTISPECIES: hypothetical protein [Paenibacillus]VTR56526.1 Uncharacterised protein [Actinobacillus pleuropneumoniae]AVV56829.1 hypothetical protein C7121_12255 [Paenibacillus glucanolyticus]AYB48077.1 hypothetical protein D5F53_32665 [Paenibacillus lautus]KZS43346.1 hypothetical protein AWU65_01650 [Paenibacillus glucanolyticus]KZS43384.1 hypothetical protein AWU65_25050 [Paenibacillus glucanolyticus]